MFIWFYKKVNFWSGSHEKRAVNCRVICKKVIIYIFIRGLHGFLSIIPITWDTDPTLTKK